MWYAGTADQLSQSSSLVLCFTFILLAAPVLDTVPMKIFPPNYRTTKAEDRVKFKSKSETFAVGGKARQEVIVLIDHNDTSQGLQKNSKSKFYYTRIFSLKKKKKLAMNNKSWRFKWVQTHWSKSPYFVQNVKCNFLNLWMRIKFFDIFRGVRRFCNSVCS